MKRIFSFLLVFVLLLSLFTFAGFAEGEEVAETPENEVATETAPETDGTNAPNEGVELSQSDENKIYDKVIAFVTDGAFWAKFGAIVVGLLALIGVISSNLNKIKGAIDAVIGLVKGNATKEEATAAINLAVSAMKKDYEKQTKEINEKVDELAKKNDTTTAVLSLVALHLVKSPNARVEIMNILTEAKKINGNVGEVVEALEEEIKKADEAIKPDTPALDAIKAAVDEKKEEAAPIINMA